MRRNYDDPVYKDWRKKFIAEISSGVRCRDALQTIDYKLTT